MRRAVRMFVAEVCLLSLLACVGVGWMWWRSHRGDRPRLSLRLPVTRYTVRTEPGRLTLWGPPPPATAAGAAKAKRAAAMLRNRDIRYTAWAGVDTRQFELRDFSEAAAEPGTPAATLWLASADAIAPLLEAMEDADRFAAAHVLLTHRVLPHWVPPNRDVGWVIDALDYTGDANEQGNGLATELGPSGIGRVTYNGMRIEFWPVRTEVDRLLAEDRATYELVRGQVRVNARVDPAQLPALRKHWHDKLDVPLRSAPHWAVVLGLAAPPALWCATRGRRGLRRRRRGRLGLCVACGYDLRNIAAGRCPECGMRVSSKGAAA
jgi:hypothetical protein